MTYFCFLLMFLHLKTPPTEALLRQYLPTVRNGGEIIAVGSLSAPPRVAVFDLDATLIPCEFIDELAARRGAVHLTREQTRLAMSGETDFRSSFTRRLAVLRGTPVIETEHLIAAIPLAPGAVETVSALRAAGCRTAIITGGYARLGRAIQRRLGVDALYATELEESGGLLTGGVNGRLLDEEGKADALRDFCRKCGKTPRDAVAVGDGANDLKMLSAAGLAVLYTSMPAMGHSVRSMEEIFKNLKIQEVI